MKPKNMPGKVALRRARALARKNDKPEPTGDRGVVDMTSRLGAGRRAADGTPTVNAWTPRKAAPKAAA